MEKPIVLVWRESLASDVIKAHVLETGAAPELQGRDVRVELAELAYGNRLLLGECLQDYGTYLLVTPHIGTATPVRLIYSCGSGLLRLPDRTVREWPSEARDRADALHYARETIAKARKAVDEREAMIVAAREKKAAEEAAEEAKRAADAAARAAALREQERVYLEALRGFLRAHGTPVDLERLEAGVYPHEEAERAARALALAPVRSLGETYQRITSADLDHDEDCVSLDSDEDEETKASDGRERLTCRTQDHTAADLPPMNAELWTTYRGFVDRLPAGATWTLRRHEVECDDCGASRVRWSLLVRVPTELPQVFGSVRLAVV